MTAFWLLFLATRVAPNPVDCCDVVSNSTWNCMTSCSHYWNIRDHLRHALTLQVLNGFAFCKHRYDHLLELFIFLSYLWRIYCILWWCCRIWGWASMNNAIIILFCSIDPWNIIFVVFIYWSYFVLLIYRTLFLLFWSLEHYFVVLIYRTIHFLLVLTFRTLLCGVDL